MARTSGQQPGERDRDYFARLKAAKSEEQAIREKASQRKPGSPEEQANNVVTNLDADIELTAFAAEMFGQDLESIQRELDVQAKRAKLPGVDKLAAGLAAAGKKGWTKKGRARSVKRYLRGNKKAIKAATKKRGFLGLW
jgi:hypothetical protein